jgi:hypothetical protein
MQGWKDERGRRIYMFDMRARLVFIRRRKVQSLPEGFVLQWWTGQAVHKRPIFGEGGCE